MTTVKKLIIISASAGASFAVVFVSLSALLLWWQSRPEPPQPWNGQAISATFESIRVHGTEQKIIFGYTLRNNTNSDYRIESMNGISLMIKLEEPTSLRGNVDEVFKCSIPFFLPAREQVLFELESVAGFKSEIKTSRGTDQKPTKEELTTFVNEKMQNLNGFVLFDEAHRYKIDFPRGWRKP
jgi:hypothetical protein